MDKDKIRAFADKVLGDMAGAMTSGMGYIGVTTGLFRAMAGKGGMRVEDVARETKLVPHYVEEWLKGMTCAKYVEYDPATQTYRLPDEHAYLLASDDSSRSFRCCCGLRRMWRLRFSMAAASRSRNSGPTACSASM
jgi:hypothetical protein